MAVGLRRGSILLHGHEAKNFAFLEIKPIKIDLAEHLNFRVVMKVFA